MRLSQEQARTVAGGPLVHEVNEKYLSDPAYPDICRVDESLRRFFLCFFAGSGGQEADHLRREAQGALRRGLLQRIHSPEAADSSLHQDGAVEMDGGPVNAPTQQKERSNFVCQVYV